MTTNIEDKILHGTTTVGIKASDGVVLCADMRASAGYFIANNNTMKIQKIYESCWLNISWWGCRCAKFNRHFEISCKYTRYSNKRKHYDKITSKTLLSRIFIKTEAIHLLLTSCLVVMIVTDLN